MRQWDHDAEHAAQIATWREERALEGDAGPKAVLIAALKAARDELLTSVALVPRGQRTSRRVCGAWTLRDVVGHVADWEQVAAEGLRDMATGRPPDVAHIPDIDAWNAERAAARRDQPWEACWADLRGTRERLLEILREMSQKALRQSYPFPWDPRGTAYPWARVFAAHDREHAQGVRERLGPGSEPNEQS
ncbi:MAG: DinB family protein [Chloroflexota bacterium]